VVAAFFCGSAVALADWPLIWDFDGRGDEPVAARHGVSGAAAGDLWVLTSSYAQGQPSPQAVLLRIAPDGGVVWAVDDPDLHPPQALALRDDGSTLAIGQEGTGIRVTAFTAAGTIAWSRSRSGVAADVPLNGPQASPVWDETAVGGGAWRIPCGLAGDFAVLSFTAAGDPLADVVWAPPAGEGRATSLLPRAGGGLLLAGLIESPSPPGWWTVALDVAGMEVWKRFDDGGTPAGIFTGAFLLSADPVRVWADDETLCGLFSLRLWALDAATGAPLWDSTWPPNGEPSCDSFTPDAVTLEGDRILAAGVGNVASVGASFDPIAVSVDAVTGTPQWARVFAGATTGIRAEIVSAGGSALLASTLFPSPNPGPTPLWLAAWDRDGGSCGVPLELLPARVNAAIAIPSAAGTAGGLLVGYAFNFGGGTGSDLLVQRVDDPCAGIFRDDFESGGTGQWSAAQP
jgi:hypothetical protein